MGVYHNRYTKALFIFFNFMLFYGCQNDPEYKYIDFSKRLPESAITSRTEHEKTIYVAVSAMISPKETVGYYHDILRYIGESAGGYEVRLIQRKTYGEINELMQKGRIDFAFICSGPYATGRETYGFKALATPVVRDQPYYQSYLIVAKNSSYTSLEDLRGHVFAFTDPDSNSGALVPNYWLSEIGEQSTSFFSRVVYTYSHDNSILAVAKGLVDGAAIDGYKWEYFAKNNPVYTSMTRVIRKSKPFGSPPLVAAAQVSDQLKQRVGRVINNMHTDPEGREILGKLMIDRFLQPEEHWYQPVRDMYRALQFMKARENETQAS